MKTIAISEATLNTVIQYLASCPFAHVEQLIAAIRNDVAIDRQAEAAKVEAEKKPDEPVKVDPEVGGNNA